MAQAEKRTELKRISSDLEEFVQTYCNLGPGEPSSFADEKCNDAYLMLQEALSELERTE